MKQEILLVEQLLHGRLAVQPDHDNTLASKETFETYYKVLAAKEIAKLPSSILVDAVLCRSALTADEDDRVRTEALQQLINIHSDLTEAVLVALLFDGDPEMRIAAIEGLVILQSPVLWEFVEVLAVDDASDVKSLIQDFVDGKEIRLYHLSSISQT